MNLNKIIKELDKKYGEGTLLYLDENKKIDIDVIPTGSVSLDDALGIGGIPIGRIIEIYGAESSGKTTLALTILAQAQKKGLKCAFIDAEHSLDTNYAKNLGVQLSSLLLSQPNSGEQALDITENLVKSNEIGLIVIDSVAALTPEAEIEGTMGQMHIGLQARLMSQALRKLTAITANSKTTIIFINQTRSSIGITWGSPVVTSGGKALKFYTSIRIEIKISAKLTKGTDVIGRRTIVKVVKNKLAAPFKTTEFDIIFNEGICYAKDLLIFAHKKKVIQKTGNTFYFEKEKLGVGIERSKNYLQKNPKILEKIAKELQKKE
jgi:recombination protein RecA